MIHLEDIFRRYIQEVKRKNSLQIWGKFNKGNQTTDEREGKIDIQANTIKKRYKWHSCLRIHVIESSEDERNDSGLQKVKECYKEMNLPSHEENIDRGGRKE